MNISQKLTAAEIASAAISPRDRVLITGATGWFGKTALELAGNSGADILLIGRYDLEFELGGRKYLQNTWSDELIENFKPTIAIDTAFITREKIQETGIDSYVSGNREIITRSLQIASLQTLKTYIGFSSGAVFQPKPFGADEDPYAILKRSFEEDMRKLSLSSSANINILRTWSVAGKHVTKPEIFAFSNLIIQSHTSRIEIKSENPVWRRYCSVEELIAIGLASPFGLKFSLIDSGGTLVEIQELATTICKLSGRYPQILCSINESNVANHYHSDNSDWAKAVSIAGLRTKTLEELILEVEHFLFPLLTE